MSVREELLTLLEGRRGELLSGEEAAGLLGVSRAAVHKAADALRAEGVPLEAQRGSGYRLAPGCDLVRAETLRAWLPAGTPLRALPVAGSTNNEAKAWAAAGAPHGALVVAEQQAAGKGRLGRHFDSPPGGLYLSMVLRPTPGREQSGLMRLTAAAAVAVCRAVQQSCGLAPGIKWVNDVFYEGKKICGILTEGVSALESGGFEYLVVGIGINYTTPPKAFSPEVRGVAGSLFPAGGAPVPRAALAAALHAELLGLFNGLEGGAFMEEYRRHSLVPGRRVTVLAKQPYEAEALRIDDDARLWVRRSDGSETALAAGEISVRL